MPVKFIIWTLFWTTSRQFVSRAEVPFKGHEIESLHRSKLLGVTIDNKLKFNEHITAACKKGSQGIGVLLRLKNLVPTSAKLQLLKAAISTIYGFNLT